MSQEPEAQDQRDEDAREALDRRLHAALEREAQRKGEQAKAQTDESYRLGNRVLTELIAGIGGGAFFGWVVDRLIGNGKHWGLLVVMALGTIVAFRNIIRISTRRPD
jgi:ATP synthase protein I